jgi:hypothetical protein
VGALLAAGGLALEKLLRTHGLPSRGVWAVTIVLSVAWPVGQWAWENRPVELPPATRTSVPAVAPEELPRTALPLEPIAVEVPREFSCKGRGVCPSCNAKRMAQTAAHLVERSPARAAGYVLPVTPSAWPKVRLTW